MRRYDEDVSAARIRERRRRVSLARNRAVALLIDNHYDEYNDYYEAAKRQLDMELGPLPGDDGR